MSDHRVCYHYICMCMHRYRRVSSKTPLKHPSQSSQQSCVSYRLHLLNLPSSSRAVYTCPSRNAVRLGLDTSARLIKDTPCTSLPTSTFPGICRRYEKGFLPDTFRLLATFFAFVGLASSPSSSTSLSESIAFLLRLPLEGRRSSLSRRTRRFER